MNQEGQKPDTFRLLELLKTIKPGDAIAILETVRR